jgi:purine-binding chemotaxis protein CheW
MTPMTRSDEARVLPGSARETPHSRRALLLFHLAGQAYGLPLSQVREVVLLAELSRPPDLPIVVAGFLNLGGIAIPVLRLNHLFGLPPQPTGLYTPLILLRHPDSPLALLVDRVDRILSVSTEAVVALPENHSFNDCVEGVATVEDRLILLLSPERILLEKEQQCLAEFQYREQARLRGLQESQP